MKRIYLTALALLLALQCFGNCTATADEKPAAESKTAVDDGIMIVTMLR